MSDGKIEKVTEIKEEFEQIYMFSEPWSEYVNMCGITDRVIAETDWRDGVPGRENTRQALLAAGENPDELCIRVGLRKPLPEELSLPEIFKGIRVYVILIGEITLF